MAIFIYRATDILTQETIKGEMTADNKASLYQKLVEKNLYPKYIKKKAYWRSIFHINPKLKTTDIVFLCKQLSALLEAGVSIIETIEICTNQCRHHTLKNHLEHMKQSVQNGEALGLAMEKEKIFPTFMVRLIECGEQTGHLVKAIQQIEVHLEHQTKLQDNLKRALTYPITVLGLVSLMIVLMVVKVIPTYVQLLKDVGGEIPFPTALVIQVSLFISHYWITISISFFILGVCLNRIYQVKKIREKFERFYLNVPLLNQLIKKIIAARFAGMLAMMIESGVPILEAMEMTEQLIHYSVAQKEINIAIKKLEAGYLLVDAFRNSVIYPPILLSMMSIGEESHTLPRMLNHMEQYFKEEVTKEMEQLIVFIQPIMMIIIGLILGGMMAAILLPTFSVVTNIG